MREVGIAHQIHPVPAMAFVPGRGWEQMRAPRHLGTELPDIEPEPGCGLFHSAPHLFWPIDDTLHLSPLTPHPAYTLLAR